MPLSPSRTILWILHMKQSPQPLRFEKDTSCGVRKAQVLLIAVFDDRAPFSTIGFHLISIGIQLPNYNPALLDNESHCFPGCGTCACIMLGISSHVRPSRILPVRFLKVPPHYLKKKATSLSKQLSRISRTQSECISRAPGPDSPPTMTQSIPSS